MASELTITCDECGEEITDKAERVQIQVLQLKKNQQQPSMPTTRDYHEDCAPEWVAEVT